MQYCQWVNHTEQKQAPQPTMSVWTRTCSVAFFLMLDLSQCFSRYFICWKSICLRHLFTQYISKLVIKTLSQIPSSLPFYFLLSGQFYIKFVLLPWIFWFLPCWTVFYVVPSQRTFFISTFCKFFWKKMCPNLAGSIFYWQNYADYSWWIAAFPSVD